MKRDYNLLKAIFYFVEQKVRETWPLWGYLAILGIVEYMGADLRCSDCSPLGAFILIKVIVLPGLSLIIGLVLCIVCVELLRAKDNFSRWKLSFKSWIWQNWHRAKARAKYE